MRLLHIDVFTMTPFTGNPACVIIHDGDLSPDARSMLAAEVNQPESVYVRRTAEGYDLTFFTRGRDIEFCGHGTVAAIWGLSRMLGTRDVTVSTPGGEVRGWVDDGCAYVPQRPPTFRSIRGGAESLSRILGISVDEIDPDLPLEIAEMGIRQLIVPVVSLDVLRSLRVDQKKMGLLTAYAGLDSVHVFAMGGFDPECRTHARHFAPYYNIPEDPVTGTGNTAMVVYLARHGVIDPQKERRVLCEQGHLLGRPGMVIVDIECDPSTGAVTSLRFGGACVEVMQGEVSPGLFTGGAPLRKEHI